MRSTITSVARPLAILRSVTCTLRMTPGCWAGRGARTLAPASLPTAVSPAGSVDGEIRFYTQQQTHFFLTNYAPAPFEIAGQLWPTVEHYFQAMKFPSNPAYQESIREAPTPGQAKRMGAAKHIPIRPDWDVVRDDVMRTALRAKFDANPDFKAGLLLTGSRTLVEDSPTDYYWGCGKDRTGRSMLGQLLMQLRDEYRNAAGKAGAEGAGTCKPV